MDKVKTIPNRAKWIESLKPGDVSTGHVQKARSLKAVAVQLSDYNAGKGREKGCYVHATYDKPNLNVTLVAVTWEQHEREIADAHYRDEWRKLLPNGE